MKKLILYASLLCIGLASCTKDFVVDEESLPSWLGESIYGELKNPKSLNGTFNTYIRLIDDMGYTEVLGKTGSKTIFPANDAAFEEFFKDGNNRYGATSYDQLTYNEKAQLLYSSMLDNAILIGNISTEQNANRVRPLNIRQISSLQTLLSRGIRRVSRIIILISKDLRWTMAVTEAYMHCMTIHVHLLCISLVNICLTMP